MIYVMIEAYRYHRMLKLQRHLHDHRTPLSDGFDRKQWAVFMLTALRQTAALGGMGYTSAYAIREAAFPGPHAAPAGLQSDVMIHVPSSLTSSARTV